MSRKKSVLFRRKALYLFVNTLTTDDKYSLLNRDNLTQPIPTQLSERHKIFPNFFLHFLNLHELSNIFKKRMTLIADFFPKLRTPENVARYMSIKSRFKGPFDRQHGKRVQTVLQSGQQHCYHIY